MLLILFLSAALAPLTAFSQQKNPAWGKPLLVLTETNPNLMVPGADVPSFALYEGGQIIYSQVHRSGTRYYHTQLAQEEQQKLLSKVLESAALEQLPEQTSLSTATSQPMNELVLNFDTLLVKKVYGNLRNNAQVRKIAPASFLKVYDQLTDFEDKQAREWLPEKIEVLVTDYRKSSVAPLKWPAEWPSLKSPDTVWRSEKLYSLYLDKKHFQDLLNLMEKLDEGQAVEINGKKWQISYRLPFPNL